MAGMTTRRNSPFSPFSEKFDAEILPSPFIGEEENGGKKRRPEKDPFDARVVCPDCQHLAQRKRCMNWKAAGLRAPEVAAGIKAMHQHCPGFARLLPSAQGPPPAPAPTPRPTQTEARPTATEPPQPVQPILKGHDMALTVSEGATGTYTPPEAGTFPARCCALIDLGTQTATYEGETKAARKILVSFEITDSDNRRDDGSPHIVSKRFTASLHPKAGLRKFLEAWRGRPFTAEELKAFDLKTLLGIPCLLGIVHQEKGDRVYANLSSCMKLPKGFAAAPGAEPLVSFDLDAPDWQAFAGLSSRLQAQIAEAPEFAKANPPKTVQLAAAGHAPAQGTAAPAAPPSPPAGAAGSGFDDMADDEPF